jgi:uncharacterized membrane protein
MARTNNKRKQYNTRATGGTRRTVVSALIVVAVVAAAALALKGGGTGGNAGGSADVANESATAAAVVKDADLVISVDDISATARFYPVETDGTMLEVIAVKAPDGTIRTAFNTCQVCYDSGRGYYKQDGDVLVCQNCGNRFRMDQVEVQSGGCNPVPIFAENKTVTDESITVSKDFLTEAKVIFENWKTEY